jgi:hypothetical protein
MKIRNIRRKRMMMKRRTRKRIEQRIKRKK